jgi:hypothetical protein
MIGGPPPQKGDSSQSKPHDGTPKARAMTIEAAAMLRRILRVIMDDETHILSQNGGFGK